MEEIRCEELEGCSESQCHVSGCVVGAKSQVCRHEGRQMG